MAMIEIGKNIRPQIEVDAAEALLAFLDECTDIDDPLVLRAKKSIKDSYLKLQLGITKGTPIVRKRVTGSELGFDIPINRAANSINSNSYSNANVDYTVDKNLFERTDLLPIDKNAPFAVPVPRAVHTMKGPNDFATTEEYDAYVFAELERLGANDNNNAKPIVKAKAKTLVELMEEVRNKPDKEKE